MNRTNLSYIAAIRGNELLKRLSRLGKANGVNVRYDGKPGKGSHGRLYYGGVFTTIKDIHLTKDDLT